MEAKNRKEYPKGNMALTTHSELLSFQRVRVLEATNIEMWSVEVRFQNKWGSMKFSERKFLPWFKQYRSITNSS